MANVQIPREAVEAGARALIPATWDETPPFVQHMMREQAVTVLDAAAFDNMAREIDDAPEDGAPEHDAAFNAGQSWVKEALRKRAEHLRVQT